jgi:hypothetical protein
MNRRDLLFLLGCAVAAPHPLRAQQKAMPVIGYLNGTTPEANAALLAVFRQGLATIACRRARRSRSVPVPGPRGHR